MKQMMNENQALSRALEYAGLAKTESRCAFRKAQDGLYEFTVLTLYQKYDFYVDALSGEVLGVNSEPLPYQEMFCTEPVLLPEFPEAA